MNRGNRLLADRWPRYCSHPPLICVPLGGITPLWQNRAINTMESTEWTSTPTKETPLNWKLYDKRSRIKSMRSRSRGWWLLMMLFPFTPSPKSDFANSSETTSGNIDGRTSDRTKSFVYYTFCFSPKPTWLSYSRLIQNKISSLFWMLRMKKCISTPPLLRIVLDICVVWLVSHALDEEGKVWRAHHHVKKRIIRMTQSIFYSSSNSNRIHLATIQTAHVYDSFICIQFEQSRFLAFANILVQSKTAI